MERLTTNKSVADMSMIELAHNSCYADDERNARYRDYEMEMDARDFARNLMVTLAKDELPVDDAEFDEEILDNLTIDPFLDVRGLIALFYRNMWAMAYLREKLKDYEDAEEQGRYIKLPEKVEETEYRECVHTRTKCHHENCKCSECPLTELFCDEFYTTIDRCYEDAYARGCLAGIELGKAEAKLKEMEEKSMIKGKKVVMNDKYYVSEKNKGKIFEVTSEPYSVCGTVVVKLKGLSGCYVLDGLDEVKDGR